jgi:nucleoside-diphosphate-sugar epimerase
MTARVQQGPESALRLLVTGARGFVGTALCRHLLREQMDFRGATRQPQQAWEVPCGELAADTDWRPLLAGRNCVIHLAARVHVMREAASDPLAEYRRVNVEGSLQLARQALECGVKRFVFVSTIKVNGEATHGRAFRASDLPAPTDPYGMSKLEAEDGLRRLSAEGGLELVVLRPPLVYGPGVGGNFRTLTRAIERGLPLPLGCANNRRSLLAVDNLVDLLLTCARHSAAPGQTFLASDDCDLSTAELVRQLAHAMGRSPRLLPVPASLVQWAATMLGKPEAARRLFEDLAVDISATRQLLQWSPPCATGDALRKMLVQDHYNR